MANVFFFSAQHLVDCSKQNLGRHGGLTDYAFPYYKDVEPEVTEPPEEPRAWSHEERDAKTLRLWERRCCPVPPVQLAESIEFSLLSSRNCLCPEVSIQ